MTPYRRHLLGLPLQRSLFRGVRRTGAILQKAGIFPENRVDVRLDEGGNLFLERSSLERLKADLPAQLTVENLRVLELARRAACSWLTEATGRASQLNAELDPCGAKTLLAEIGTGVAEFVPYGILTKFIPDALLQTLASLGNSGPPAFPVDSPGAALTKALLNLAQKCSVCGYPPYRLAGDWPEVAPEAAALVRDFCCRHQGFGPLPWEAPGYEDPEFVVRACRGAFGQVDLEELQGRLANAFPRRDAVSSPSSPLVHALRQALAFWLDFLERETWYVRRAFYMGILPALRRLCQASDRRLLPEDMLFLEIQEITASELQLEAIPARRDAYLANVEYLERHAVDPDRLIRNAGDQ
jgi:hypothetical protein